MIKTLTPDFWKGKKVVVTGGNGFLGKHVVPLLDGVGADVFVPKIEEYDLRNLSDCMKATSGADIVIHLAAVFGGIRFNLQNLGRIFYDNIMMNTNAMEAARLNNVGKFVGICSACAYPEDAPMPLREEYLFKGKPEPANETYGLSKLMMVEQAQAYSKQYGFNAIIPVLFNFYGPHDNFDPETANVIPSMIMRYLEKEHVVNFGDGSQTRSFLYVEDAAEAILLAAEYHNSPDPINIGSEEEVSMAGLASMISRLTGFKGTVEWSQKSGGQPRRCADVSKAYDEFGFKAKTPLEVGIKKTIGWYKENKVGSISSKNL